MREIKFRGYKQKSFGCENCLGDLYEGCTELCKCKVGTMISDCSHKLPKGWVVMQFTGLLDKNGKEIYEGDICKYDYSPDDVVVIGWDDSLLTDKATVVSEGIYCEDYFFIKSDSSKYEVVGNIYSNPELISK